MTTNYRLKLNEHLQFILHQSLPFAYEDEKTHDCYKSTLKLGSVLFEGHIHVTKAQAHNSAAKTAYDKLRPFFDETDLREELGLEPSVRVREVDTMRRCIKWIRLRTSVLDNAIKDELNCRFRDIYGQLRQLENILIEQGIVDDGFFSRDHSLSVKFLFK